MLGPHSPGGWEMGMGMGMRLLPAERRSKMEEAMLWPVKQMSLLHWHSCQNSCAATCCCARLAVRRFLAVAADSAQWLVQHMLTGPGAPRPPLCRSAGSEGPWPTHMLMC